MNKTPALKETTNNTKYPLKFCMGHEKFWQPHASAALSLSLPLKENHKLSLSLLQQVS
jgi:hypothetical protein